MQAVGPVLEKKTLLFDEEYLGWNINDDDE